MPLSDYFSPKQFAFTPDKAAAIGTGNEGQKFMSKSYDPTVNNLQSIGPAYWDYVAHTLDKAGKPRTDYTGMLQDMLGRYGTVTADTKAPDWFLKGERYNYFNPQSPTAYFKNNSETPGEMAASVDFVPGTPESVMKAERERINRSLGGISIGTPAIMNPELIGSPKGPTVTAPAGNNIASGAVAPPNPSSAMSGTQISTTAPNTGTIGTDINQSPFSPTAGTRKRTSPNKYFNQRWFGTKQLA